MEIQKEPIYHNLFFADIEKKIDNYVKFRRECVEIAILAEIIPNESKIDFNFISIIDPKFLREDNNIDPRDSARLDSDGYVYHWNSQKQDFMSFIENVNNNNQLPKKYIIFQGYIDKKLDINAKEPLNENILSKLSIQKIMWNVEKVNNIGSINNPNEVNDLEIQKWMPNNYSEKNTIFDSYLKNATRLEFNLDMKDVDRFFEEIKKEIRTNPNNVNFKNVKPITEKINETMVDYEVINYIIQYSFPNNAEKYNETYKINIPKNNEYIRDYIYYFAYDKPSYTIYDLIKDSFMTIKLDKIIIETEENGKKQKKPINLKSNKSLDNLNMIFDIPYFKDIIEKNKKIKKEEDKINILFLFYEMLLKFYNIFDTYISSQSILCEFGKGAMDPSKKLDNTDFFKKIYIPLTKLTCIFYKCSVEYVSDGLNTEQDKHNIQVKEKYNEFNILIKISIIDKINIILHNLLIKIYEHTNNKDPQNVNMVIDHNIFNNDILFKRGIIQTRLTPHCLEKDKNDITQYCKDIDKNVLNPYIYKDKSKLKYLRDNVELFIREIEDILLKKSAVTYQPNNVEIIQDLEKEIVARENIMNKIIDINKPNSKFKKYFNYSLMTLGVLVGVGAVALTIVGAVTGVPVNVQMNGLPMFGFEEGKNLTKALEPEEEKEN